MTTPFLQFLTEYGRRTTDDPAEQVEVLFFGSVYAMAAAAEFDDDALQLVGPLNWDSCVDARGFRRNPAHLYPCPECGRRGQFTAGDLRVRCQDRGCPMHQQELPRAVWQHLGLAAEKSDGRIRKLRVLSKTRPEA